MVSVFDYTDPARADAVPGPADDLLGLARQQIATAAAELEGTAETGEILATALQRHGGRIVHGHAARLGEVMQQAEAVIDAFHQNGESRSIFEAWVEYQRDAAERLVLSLDALRRRGDIFLEHEEEGCPPVLVYDTEQVMDGRDLPLPSNYMLLRILPPEGVQIDPRRRPYVIIDPRAGHGPGIGGFKTDSQVGVALRAGHPVYFVAFRRAPEPGQFLSYVTRAEAAFVREVIRVHPESARPVVIGNCQGGWASLLLAAMNPDLTGPVVINGAPVATWSGRVGENPMRYNAGLAGGTWIPMMLSDLGGGVFDGAHLVANFELMNPSRTLFRKYTDLYRDIDTAEPTFLDFERWWGGFFLLAEPEIRWIVEQLFVGNRLVKNEARIEPGRPVDLKAIRAPIIVFASHGDTITPPQQALNWIAATYADVAEIRIRGQRIVYMVHEEVGHLGIFVSSKIANREHSEVASTLKTIEALAPGLYEMTIEDVTETDGRKHFTVGFCERTLDDIRALDDGQADERPFAAVARVSEVQTQLYETLLRPVLRSLVTETSAELSRALHPERLSRALVSSRNPAMAPLQQAAEQVRKVRTRAHPANPFLAAEALWVQGTEQMIDFWRDSRDMAAELAFHSLWGNPWARAFGAKHESRRTLKSQEELRALPEVVAALYAIEQGGFVEAVIRMLVLLAENRGQVRRDRLERSARVLTRDAPFRALGAERRALIIHQQTLIATFEPERAVETLPRLLPEAQDRALALRVVRYIPGAVAEMSPETQAMLARFETVLGLEPMTVDVTEDPLSVPPPVPVPAALSPQMSDALPVALAPLAPRPELGAAPSEAAPLPQPEPQPEPVPDLSEPDAASRPARAARRGSHGAAPQERKP
ncbi:alpha/beta fold hydrolase [Rhodobacter capsulatus]|uniref:DUF3141 domain-containing protein n=1 Tax=Rhodobacter capsulatus TaxID=1061 RepID=A0A1G7SWS6_RHOCA|nr:DUF3141 domain-containing protein [Rhodobacter capsulatus]WER08603.1 alpha/beta fold hydrolase [Rhodobacter capsulatus]SDG27322.1 Protein of unknown function [Rhodobacter capsulatus]